VKTRFDIPLGAARLAVSDNAAALDGAVRRESLRQPVLINVPAEVADEQVLDTLLTRCLSLCLLDDGLGLSLSLALLGRNLLLGVAVAGVVGVRIGVRGVIGIRLQFC
jgi:hypothetical protein